MKNLTLITQALLYAAEKHAGQFRKDGKTPYINHPIQLAAVLASTGNITDPETIACALLHDTIEDTDATARDIEQLFGKTVRNAVEELTDDENLSKIERKRQQVLKVPSQSEMAKLVRLADKICNLRDLLDKPPQGWAIDRQRKYWQWCTFVIQGTRGINRQLETLFDQISKEAEERYGWDIH